MLCQREEREAGRAYPRTCPTCKLGPCQKLGAKPLQSLADAQAEISRLTAALEEVTAERDRQYDENVHRIAEQARAEAERDTARAETAMAFEVAKDAIVNALDMQGAQMAGRYDQNKLDFHAICALTTGHATAALAARDRATREQALRECAAYHQGEIDRLDAQIADNEAYMQRSGRGVSEANKFCRDQQSSHRIARDAIRARI